ncbi:hypothetical protein [Streptomyces sp. A5-4]
MSIRAVLVAALITGLVLGIASARSEHSASPRGAGSLSQAGR